MIIVSSTRRTPGYLGQVMYGLCEYDKTDHGHRTLHLDDHGNFVFRGGCEVIYIDAYGREADISQWVGDCMRLQYLYGQERRKKSVYTHTFTLSWHPLDDITPEQAIAVARDFVERFLQGHGVLYECHFDTDNKHVHVVISAWRELDLADERPWMRRNKDGQVIASEVKAGSKINLSNAMRAQMNDYAYHTSLANGWVAVDFNALIDQRKGERYADFTARVRDTLLFFAQVSLSWHDFSVLAVLHKINIASGEGVVRNWDDRWVRSFAELDLSMGQIAHIIGEQRDAAPKLTAEEQILRVVCLACVHQTHSWVELCKEMESQYGIEMRCEDGHNYILRGMQREVRLGDLALPERVQSRIKEFYREETVRRRVDNIKQLPMQEQLSYVAMLADEVTETDALCRELYERYKAMADEEEILEQYWRVYFSCMDLFWREYRSRGREIWESYRDDVHNIYVEVRDLKAAMLAILVDMDRMTTGAIVAAVLIDPMILLIAVLMQLLAMLLAVKLIDEVERRLDQREIRKQEYIIERERHKAMAKMAAKKDLSLVERYNLLRSIEDECAPAITKELLEDMRAYMRTPTGLWKTDPEHGR